MGRAPCCDKASVKKGPWSPEEDAQLKAYIDAHGTGGNWIALPRKIGLKRCGKSCRLRWLNYLRPNIRHGGFSEEEDRVICSLYISIGSRWSTIAAQLPGRTDNDVKNYWNTKLKKRLLGGRRSEDVSPSQPRDRFLLTNYYGSGKPPLTATALERMQLQMQLQQGQESAFPYYNNPALVWPKLSLPSVSVQSSYTSVGVQENLDGGTPPLSTSAEAVGVECSSSTVSSAAMGIEDEIDVLLHQMKCFEAGVDCFREMDETNIGSWSSCSTDLGVESVFQDYVQGYSNQ